MNIKHTLAALVVALFGAAQVHAVAIPFSVSNLPNIGGNGMTSSTFTLDESNQNLDTASVQFDLGTVDEGIEVIINGTSIFDVARFDNNPGGPVGVTPGLFQPWNLGTLSRPRIIATITNSSVTLAALLNAGDAAYSPISFAAPTVVTLPTFIDGVNTIDITNNNASGPGGSGSMALSGTVQIVPEPATAALSMLGLAGLAGATRRRRNA